VTIIADRGLFVRLLVQSGKFAAGEAESFADALDAASKGPATKADLAEVRTDIALLSQRIDGAVQRLDARIDTVGQRLDAAAQRLDARIDTMGDRLFVRLGGLMLALTGALFAALRLTQP
jgi:hypothetical protein